MNIHKTSGTKILMAVASTLSNAVLATAPGNYFVHTRMECPEAPASTVSEALLMIMKLRSSSSDRDVAAMWLVKSGRGWDVDSYMQQVEYRCIVSHECFLRSGWTNARVVVQE